MYTNDVVVPVIYIHYSYAYHRTICQSEYRGGPTLWKPQLTDNYRTIVNIFKHIYLTLYSYYY